MGLGVGFVLDTVVVDVLVVGAGVVVVVVVDVVVDVVVVVGGASTFKEYKCETLKYYFRLIENCWVSMIHFLRG